MGRTTELNVFAILLKYPTIYKLKILYIVVSDEKVD